MCTDCPYCVEHDNPCQNAVGSSTELAGGRLDSLSTMWPDYRGRSAATARPDFALNPQLLLGETTLSQEARVEAQLPLRDVAIGMRGFHDIGAASSLQAFFHKLNTALQKDVSVHHEVYTPPTHQPRTQWRHIKLQHVDIYVYRSLQNNPFELLSVFELYMHCYTEALLWSEAATATIRTKWTPFGLTMWNAFKTCLLYTSPSPRDRG